MSLGRGKWMAGVLLAGWMAGCSDTTEPGPATCADFTGAYIPQIGASCSDTKVIAVPLGACVTQQGCDLTIVSNQGTFKGTVTGDTFTVSGTFPIASQPLEQECTGTRIAPGGIDLRCTIKSGGETKATCQVPTDAMEDPLHAASLCCDYNAQDCAAGQRCSAVKMGNHELTPVIPACIPVTGSRGLDESCSRSDLEGLANAGYDDCAAGLYCSAYGVESGQPRVCRELCLKSTDCPAGRSCQWMGTDVPITGVCVPSCEVFADGCTGALTCRRYGAVNEKGAIASAGACESTGTKAIGDRCSSGSECGAGAFCSSGVRRCVAYCNDRNPCEGGKTCNRFGGEPAGSTLGACALE